MKQIIVMVAMLILGIGIGTMVMGFSEQADEISQVGIEAISGFNNQADSATPVNE